LRDLRERRVDMDGVMITKIVAGVLAALVLFVLVQRRRTRVR
jgi:hypothetical protein